MALGAILFALFAMRAISRGATSPRAIWRGFCADSAPILRGGISRGGISRGAIPRDGISNGAISRGDISHQAISP